MGSSDFGARFPFVTEFIYSIRWRMSKSPPDPNNNCLFLFCFCLIPSFPLLSPVFLLCLLSSLCLSLLSRSLSSPYYRHPKLNNQYAFCSFVHSTERPELNFGKIWKKMNECKWLCLLLPLLAVFFSFKLFASFFCSVVAGTCGQVWMQLWGKHLLTHSQNP